MGTPQARDEERVVGAQREQREPGKQGEGEEEEGGLGQRVGTWVFRLLVSFLVVAVWEGVWHALDATVVTEWHEGDLEPSCAWSGRYSARLVDSACVTLAMGVPVYWVLFAWWRLPQYNKRGYVAWVRELRQKRGKEREMETKSAGAADGDAKEASGEDKEVEVQDLHAVAPIVAAMLVTVTIWRSLWLLLDRVFCYPGKGDSWAFILTFLASKLVLWCLGCMRNAVAPPLAFYNDRAFGDAFFQRKRYRDVIELGLPGVWLAAAAIVIPQRRNPVHAQGEQERAQHAQQQLSPLQLSGLFVCESSMLLVLTALTIVSWQSVWDLCDLHEVSPNISGAAAIVIVTLHRWWGELHVARKRRRQGDVNDAVIRRVAFGTADVFSTLVASASGIVFWRASWLTVDKVVLGHAHDPLVPLMSCVLAMTLLVLLGHSASTTASPWFAVVNESHGFLRVLLHESEHTEVLEVQRPAIPRQLSSTRSLKMMAIQPSQ